MRSFFCLVLCVVLICCPSCSRITARNLDRNANERAGIPFYLPKPYLVVTKNVRHVPAPTVGLTQPAPVPDSFDPAGNELAISAAITQGRTLTLERKLAEETKYSRELQEKYEQLLEEKYNRTESDTRSDTNTTATTTTRSETDANNVTTTVSEQTSNSTTTNNNTNTTNTNTGGGANSSGVTGLQGGSTQLQGNSGPSSGRTASAIAADKQILGVSDQSVVPASSIPDGLMPETFYTYQIVYLPDLTQKYGLEIHNGPGEFRSTMNLVNGWMHTGAGPVYMRDSTSAARTVAGGVALGNVIDSIAGLGFATAGSFTPSPAVAAVPSIVPGLADTTGRAQLQGSGGTPEIETIPNYAQIWVFEPVLDKRTKTVTWRKLPDMPIEMNRDYLSISGDTRRTENNGGSELETVRERVENELPEILDREAIKTVTGESAKLVPNGVVLRRQSVVITLSGALDDANKKKLKAALILIDHRVSYDFDS